MYVLYSKNEEGKKVVLDIATKVSITDDFIVVNKSNISVRYPIKGIEIITMDEADIESTDDLNNYHPRIVLDGKVIKDPFYVEEEVPDDGSDDGSGDSDEEKPMTIAEMRTKIKELEEQLAAAKILLGME